MSLVELAGLTVAVTGLLTALGKGAWTAVRYVVDGCEERAAAYRTEATATIFAKNSELDAIKSREMRLQELILERTP